MGYGNEEKGARLQFVLPFGNSRYKTVSPNWERAVKCHKAKIFVCYDIIYAVQNSELRTQKTFIDPFIIQ